MRIKTMYIFSSLLILVIFLSGCVEESEKPQITEGLTRDIESSNSVMWVGPHADDEMYAGGILGYLCREKGYDCTTVAFGKRAEKIEGNINSSNFLNSEYIKIADTLYPDQEIVTWQGQNIPLLVKQWHEDGTYDELVDILREKDPDIIFGFEPETIYESHSLHHQASAVLLSQAIEEAGINCSYYYVIETIHMKKEKADTAEELEALGVTDTVYLNDKLWGYRLTLYDFYDDVFPALKPVIEDEEEQESLIHKELFHNTEIR